MMIMSSYIHKIYNNIYNNYIKFIYTAIDSLAACNCQALNYLHIAIIRLSGIPSQ